MRTKILQWKKKIKVTQIKALHHPRRIRTLLYPMKKISLLPPQEVQRRNRQEVKQWTVIKNTLSVLSTEIAIPLFPVLFLM
jgi:hypothetical protein